MSKKIYFHFDTLEENFKPPFLISKLLERSLNQLRIYGKIVLKLSFSILKLLKGNFQLPILKISYGGQSPNSKRYLSEVNFKSKNNI